MGIIFTGVSLSLRIGGVSNGRCRKRRDHGAMCRDA